MEQQIKPSVFISYAHHDGLDFTRRLALALSLYMDVFWDRNLQAGEYSPQLFGEIESRQFFLLIMSPSSLASTWCRNELKHAEAHNKEVALTRIYLGDASIDSELTKNILMVISQRTLNKGFVV